jgi:hypothetical protein
VAGDEAGAAAAEVGAAAGAAGVGAAGVAGLEQAARTQASPPTQTATRAGLPGVLESMLFTPLRLYE